MSQATEHTTENRRERYPSLTFLDPFTDDAAGNGIDKLDYAADVVAFVNMAITEGTRPSMTERETAGLGVILRAVEHSLRQAGQVVSFLEQERDGALRDYTTAYMTGRNDAEAERAAEETATYPRFDTAGAGEGEEVISDASDPEDSDRRHGGAAG